MHTETHSRWRYLLKKIIKTQQDHLLIALCLQRGMSKAGKVPKEPSIWERGNAEGEAACLWGRAEHGQVATQVTQVVSSCWSKRGTLEEVGVAWAACQGAMALAETSWLGIFLVQVPRPAQEWCIHHFKGTEGDGSWRNRDGRVSIDSTKASTREQNAAP